MADISKRLEKAEKYLQRSKPEAALEEYLNILDDEPANVQVRQAAADLCLALDRRSEAAELLSSLLELEFEAGESAKGSITYKKLCKITTPTPMQTFQYAQLTEKRDRKEALDAYALALQGFERQHKDKQALAACKRMVELSPTIENLQLTAEKASALGEGKTAATSLAVHVLRPALHPVDRPLEQVRRQRAVDIGDHRDVDLLVGDPHVGGLRLLTR